jgi:hypothetical protein
MTRNEPKNEGVSYNHDPCYGLMKSLWTGMIGQPVVYDADGFLVPLDRNWNPIIIAGTSLVGRTPSAAASQVKPPLK